MVVKLTTSYDAQQHHLEQMCTYADLPSLSPSCRTLHEDSTTTERFGEYSSPSLNGVGGLATPSISASAPSLDATDLHLSRTGTGFKEPTHWTSVLSGVTETKDQSASDEGSSPLEQNVLLFAGCQHAADQELLNSMPPRRECDSLVAFYFRAQEYRCKSAADGRESALKHPC